MQNPNCLECGKPLSGRADKKFCNDHCRSQYHNIRYASKRSQQKPINAILRKNHSVLSRVCAGGQCQIHRDELIERGFNIQFYTHTKSQEGEEYHYCYDFRYKMDDKGMIWIVRQF